VSTKPKPKARYRLRNWKEYNANLRRRGSLTLWLDNETVASWGDTQPQMHRTGQRGRPRQYSATAIQCMLTIRAVYHLPLRATVGFVESVFELMGYAGRLSVADPSTLSRRAATLKVALPVSRSDEPLHLVVDSTGLKVYGEGEWKVKKHGWVYHRTWLKVHLGVDANTSEGKGEIRVLGVSVPKVGDSQGLPQLLEAEQSALAQVTGDGAYHARHCYEAVASRPERPLAVFPPPRERRRGQHPRPDRGHERPDHMRRATKQGDFQGYSLHTWQHGNCKAPPLDRDQHVRRIRRVGRARWKEEVDYHKRSLAETAVFRLKAIFGAGVSSRKMATQTTEVFIRGAALNRMTALGMPDSYLVTQP
jgi:hypothetical protein